MTYSLKTIYFYLCHYIKLQQNKMSTQLGAIQYIIEICPCRLLNLVENVTKLGVSVRKIRAVNLKLLIKWYEIYGPLTFNYYINYMVRFM